MRRRVHILLTNDDGIYAPGIAALHKALARLGKVSVVAPVAEQSAVGHTITLVHPLRVVEATRRGKFFGYGVSGAPADCVKLAVLELLKRPVDLVVSGINLGSNAGVNALYSGTVAAAVEGVMLGIPSVAVSMEFSERPDFGPPARIAQLLISRVMKGGLRRDMLLNVNVPALPLRRIKGIEVSPQSRYMPAEGFERRTDPMGDHYYWIKPWGRYGDSEAGTDVHVLKKGYVAITPLHYDLTNRSLLEELRRAEWFLPR
jgi:5'-nucleotidase